MEDRHSPRPAQDPKALISLIPGKRPGCYTVRLDGFPIPKFIAELEGDTLRKRVSPHAHILKNAGAIAVCAALIHHPDIRFSWIVADVDGTKYVSTRRYFAAHALALHYQHYEPQLALPLPLWGRQKALDWEAEAAKRERRDRERRSQLSLFTGGEAA